MLVFAFLGLAASSQTDWFGKGYLIPLVAHDTVKTGNLTVTKSWTASSGYNCMGVQVNVVKISGTCNGVVKLYASIDNVNWGELTTSDTLHYGNASASKLWAFTTVPYPYYKAVATQHDARTVAKVQVYVVVRKTITTP